MTNYEEIEFASQPEGTNRKDVELSAANRTANDVARGDKVFIVKTIKVEVEVHQAKADAIEKVVVRGATNFDGGVVSYSIEKIPEDEEAPAEEEAAEEETTEGPGDVDPY